MPDFVKKENPVFFIQDVKKVFQTIAKKTSKTRFYKLPAARKVF